MIASKGKASSVNSTTSNLYAVGWFYLYCMYLSSTQGMTQILRDNVNSG